MNEIPIDPQQIMLSALVIMPIIFGLVEFIKSVLKVEGTAATVTSFVVGFCLEGLFLLETLLPYPYNVIIAGFFACLTIGLATSGYYKFAAARMIKTQDALALAMNANQNQ